MGKHSKIVFPIFLLLLFLAVGFEVVVVIVVDAVPTPPGGGHQGQQTAKTDEQEEEKDITFWVKFVIPVSPEHGDEGAALGRFVGTAIHKRPPGQKYLPQLRYVPPPSSSGSTGGKHSSSSSPSANPPPEAALAINNIAGGEHDEHGVLRKIFTGFLFDYSPHLNDHGKTKWQMGLRLLSELLHSSEFRHKNEKLANSLEEKLKANGIREKLPPPTGGHFQITITTEKGEQRLTELFPNKLKLFETMHDTHDQVWDEHQRKLVFTPKTREDPHRIWLNLELLDAKDALKMIKKGAPSPSASPPRHSGTSPHHKADGGSSPRTTGSSKRSWLWPFGSSR